MAKTPTPIEPTDKFLPKLSLFFFDRPWLSLILWVSLLTFGILSYTTFLKREGFPSINIPLVVVSGTYAQDAATIDQQISKPLAEISQKQPDVSTIQTSSQDNFFTATIQYEESANPAAAKKALQKAIESSGQIPKDATLSYAAPYFGATGGSISKIDATVSFYSPNNQATTAELTSRAEAAVAFLNKNKPPQVAKYFVESPYATVTNPATGEAAKVQRNFDRYAPTSDTTGNAPFYKSVIIGVSAINEPSVIELDEQIEASLAKLHQQSEFKDYDSEISASFAPTIKDSISELQRVLLEGLIAVLIIGSIIIAIRASLITVVAMVSVISIALGFLFLTGYSLNVITLFGLILGLSLIVDDTIIMVEAIDAARRKHTSARAAVREASRKISRAMVAATLTAAFSFVPLLFVSGILGNFIRAIPVTIISSLLISLVVALIFIPLFARYVLLGKKQLGNKGKVIEVAAGIEHRIAQFIGKPMLWSKGSRLRQFSVGFSAFAVSLVFIGAAGFLFTKVTFNIFPLSKDTNQIAIAITYPAGTNITKAESIADNVNTRVANLLGDSLVNASYYGAADNRMATLNVMLTPYGEREPTAPQLVEQINTELKGKVDASIKAYQIDVGPPASGFAVNVLAEDRGAATKLANDIAVFMKNTELKRPSGEIARFTEVAVDNTDVYTRSDDGPIIGVNANFNGTDTSTLTTLAQSAVEKEFNDAQLAKYGLSKADVTFNIGQEAENQDSFNSLALAFPVVLFATFILLAIQFRSLLQPLLIFMAVPFSLFGVAFGLFITDNPISFFALLGFFALIGLSIKNTILLTDYANQARRSGLGPIDSAVAAIAERFRPLIATSITAIFSLIPLALTSPFWEGLAYTLIFGLASSTILVILVFPYYYLAGEYVRLKVSRLIRRIRQK